MCSYISTNVALHTIVELRNSVFIASEQLLLFRTLTHHRLYKMSPLYSIRSLLNSAHALLHYFYSNNFKITKSI
jgi:hypothetical protein